MSARSAIRTVGLWVAFAAFGALAPTSAYAQAWDAVPHFQYSIENVAVSDLGAGTWNVRVVFAVLDPTSGSAWNIKAASPFQFADPLAIPAVSATLNLDIGWDPAEFTNNRQRIPGRRRDHDGGARQGRGDGDSGA